MRNTDAGFSMVDLLMIVALLLVVVGLFGPHVAKYVQKSSSTPSRAASVQPVR